MKLVVRRWFIVLVIRLPGAAEPACLGLGLDAYRDEARAVANRLASALGAPS